MTITLNGAPLQTGATTLADLLHEAGFGPKVATARNGAFVPAGLRASTPITEGDRIEVLAPMQGG
ncbi:sulfur carrier protein ThiS [Frigidibacter albus]|uniref:Sulfur carrier protein ThiS n=1 Tax=Frigidibacter albus TaxID=1465486 RepID=A0A6L8VEG4_9RHOB|nr:sulfur carrier protein ThiS [Frigidibacter albus]MZQ87630.1 sulfur carrier protein ThiS [Frigidibacter albus]NBE29536.1 sulfur carrier protein ThiS [Frigidibacter albus]GGH44251.1 thiamine biosynthesis protein ThiS [Frigidibacter albus]